MGCTKLICSILKSRLIPIIQSLTTNYEIENEIERQTRIESIAEDISEVVINAKELPGGMSRWETAVTVATWASAESNGFDPAVERGTTRGDHGRSWCIMQIHLPRGKTSQGWSGPDLIADRQKCITVGMEVMAWSMKACKHLPKDQRLAAYASGRCTAAIGLTKARYWTTTSLIKKESNRI